MRETSKNGCDDMERVHIPADAISIVSTSSKGDQSKWLVKEKWIKQNNTSFKKQLALYEGPPFIDEEKLRELLEFTPYDLGRAYDVLQMQLNDPAFEKLLIRGAKK